VLRRRLYVIGGEDSRSPLRTVQRYDPRTNRWGKRARLPARRSHVGAATAGGFVFAIGGTAPDESPSRSLFRYDPSANRWRERAPMPVALSGVSAAAALAGGRETIFVFGGRDRGNTVRRSTLAYDVASDAWRTLASMPGALADSSAVRIGGAIDVLGGVGGDGAASTALFSYDIATNSWTSLAPMRSNAFGPIGAVVGRDGRIYAIGLDWSGRRVDAYDPATDSWTGSPPDLQRSQAFPATGRIGRRIYAAGGNPASLTLSSSTLEALRVT
jgi:N-acetylneuraminic acid mutarotase